ncbi:MAG: STAS domain-containing protein [Gammaproteobacteria bacterium]|nr:STAS domain-containing protein [Gammaproteobacteria bacterium]
MQFKLRAVGKYTVIDWTGDMDLSCTSDARKQLLQCQDDGQHVLVDLTAVFHIDSSGVAVLVEGYQIAKEYGLDFGLVGVSHSVMSVLKLAHIDEIVPIHASAEALVNSEC